MILDWKKVVEALSYARFVPAGARDVADALNASDAGRRSDAYLRTFARLYWVYRGELARREALEDE